MQLCGHCVGPSGESLWPMRPPSWEECPAQLHLRLSQPQWRLLNVALKSVARVVYSHVASNHSRYFASNTGFFPSPNNHMQDVLTCCGSSSSSSSMKTIACSDSSSYGIVGCEREARP
eukprot:950115-Amphidinium_carterae.2